MSETIIDVKGLRKSFTVAKKKEGFLSSVKSLLNRETETVHAVDNIDFKVQKGEIRGLIGPNGAGKSTMIKIMSGILHPSAGTVEIMGFTPWLQREKYVKNLGVLFGQKSQLWWDLPPIDTFALNREMYKIPEARYRERVEYFKDLLQIGEVIYKPVRTLSLGERMKCELVCALLHEPELLFLDEPTIGLDIVSKETIRNFIKQANRDFRTTFIVTTHDFTDLENLCDNVTIINRGTVVYDDSMNNLKTFFTGRKIIDIKFLRPVDESSLSSYHVISHQSLTARIEIDLGEKDIKEHVYEIFDRYPVMDINIENIPIEEVIKHIYSA